MHCDEAFTESVSIVSMSAMQYSAIIQKSHGSILATAHALNLLVEATALHWLIH